MPDFRSDDLDVVAALSAIMAIDEDVGSPVTGDEVRKLRKPTKPAGASLRAMVHAAALVVANIVRSNPSAIYCLLPKHVEFLDAADMPAIDLALAELLGTLRSTENSTGIELGRRIMLHKRVNDSIEQLNDLIRLRDANGAGTDAAPALDLLSRSGSDRKLFRSEVRRAFVYSALMNYAQVYQDTQNAPPPPSALKQDAGDGEVITPARRDFEVDITQPHMILYQPQDLASFAHTIDLRFKDGPERRSMRARAQQMATNGHARALSTVPENWREKIDGIEAEMPNFSEACMVLREALAIASNSSVPVPRFPNMLLEGESGIGKSRFAAKIGDILGVKTVRIDMSSSETNSMLSGSDQHWANAKPGHVFNTLVDRGCGNPVFFLDEIDKIKTSHYDPLAPLYGLLEHDSAQCFTDKTIPDVPIDASYITWILTSNDHSLLPAPLTDRMRLIHVPTPTHGEKRHIINQIFNAINFELMLKDPVDLPDEVLEYLAIKCSTRAAADALRTGIGQALIQGRSAMRIEDLSHATRKPRSMGFVAA